MPTKLKREARKTSQIDQIKLSNYQNKFRAIWLVFESMTTHLISSFDVIQNSLTKYQERQEKTLSFSNLTCTNRYVGSKSFCKTLCLRKILGFMP